MNNQLPEWATNEISEGMKAFLSIVEEYGQFEVEFKPLTLQDDIGFTAIVSWSPFARPDIIHDVEFLVQLNFEQMYNCEGEKIDTWQAVIEDSGFTLTGQLFYMQLFQHLDANFSLLVPRYTVIPPEAETKT
jgi:hypothetical protein